MSVNIQTEDNKLHRIASVNGTDDSMIVDSELSETSENPIQNKIIYAEIKDIKSRLNKIENLLSI